MTSDEDHDKFTDVCELAKSIRQQLQIDVPTEFRELNWSVKALSNVLRDIEDVLSQRSLTVEQMQELENIAERFHRHLKQCVEIIMSYKTVEDRTSDSAGKSRTVWKTMDWEKTNIYYQLQGPILASTDAFRAFIMRLIPHNNERTADDAMKEFHKDYENILGWLAPADFTARQNDILSRKLQGTGGWLLNLEKFKTWIDEGGHIMFCPGMPGVGKTTLASTVIEHLQNRFKDDANIGIAYIYYDFGLQKEQKAVHVLANLIKQLVPWRPLMPISVRGIEITHYSNNTRPKVEELATALHRLFSEYRRIFIVVDAIDESPASDLEGYKMVHSVLKKLVQEKQGNLFVTSRLTPEVEEIFEGSLKVQVWADDDDIKRYVNEFWTPSGNGSAQEYLKGKILQAANGVFLLAKLYVQTLRQLPLITALQRITENTSFELGLERYPPETLSDILNGTYAYMIQSINSQPTEDRELAIAVLSWVTCTSRPLSPAELLHAMSVNTGQSRLNRAQSPDIDRVKKVCCGLIDIYEESNTVHLVHTTAKDRLERYPGFLLPLDEIHSNIAKACITYLLFDEFDTGACTSDGDFETRLQSYPLYTYAAQNWGYHARMASEKPTELVDLVNRLLHNKHPNLSASTQALFAEKRCLNDVWYSQRVPLQMTGLHVAAFFGLEAATVYLLGNGYSPNACDSIDRTPLTYAAQYGHKSIARLLLTVEGVNQNPQDLHNLTPLLLAAKKGHSEVVKVLLDAGASAIVEGADGNTPLSYAAANGHREVLQLLLNANGVDPDIKNLRQSTPLSLAAFHGHKEIVELLLKTGRVDPDSKDGSQRTPLSNAARSGHDSVVQLLLNTEGVDLESKDMNHDTPLKFAASRGNLSVMKLLLNAGANPNTGDRNDWTPLFHAANKGYRSAVEMLLDAGADRNYTNTNNEKAFVLAAKSGNEALVRLLLPASVH